MSEDFSWLEGATTGMTQDEVDQIAMIEELNRRGITSINPPKE